MSSRKPHMLILEELHLLVAEENRMDIGRPILSGLFAMGGKRGICLVLSDQLISTIPSAILGNLSCRIITRLIDPKCIWTAQRSMGLKAEQAAKLSETPERLVLVQYGHHPTPFLVRVDQLQFPPPPDEATLEKEAEAFLAQAKWSQDASKKDLRSASSSSDEGLTGDELNVFLRIVQHTELITARCRALGLERAQELRARRRLEVKGFVAPLDIKLGQSLLYQASAKGAEWAKARGIKITPCTHKGGPIHAYLLDTVERSLGALNPRFKFQRHSEIAKEFALQPDLVVLLPDGLRLLIEICCSNFDFEAANLAKERQIEGVDLVLAVTPNVRLKRHLQLEVEKCPAAELAGRPLAPLVILDAGECLEDDFDWTSVLERSS